MKKLSLIAMFGIVLVFLLGLSAPALADPGVEVDPTEHDFGDVELGSSSSTIIEITNVGWQPLFIDEVSLQAGSSPDFSITSAPPPGAEIASGESLEVEVTFTPSALGYVSATMDVNWKNGESGIEYVTLGGVGVDAGPPPVTIQDILTFFDDSVDDGTLKGRGRGWIAKLRLCFLRKMLEMAGRYIERDRIHFACFMLERAYKRCDSEPWPRDFVVGEATEELADMIHNLAASLGCEWVRPEYDVVVYSYTDKEGKSWIYIELKDDEGKPMPFEGYIIYLPDGTVAEGTLGQNGRARERLDKPGTCHIIFPNLDKEAWERV